MGYAVKNIKNIHNYAFGRGALAMTRELIGGRRASGNGGSSQVVYLVDEFFRKPASRPALDGLGIEGNDALKFVGTSSEPTTSGLDALMNELRSEGFMSPAVVVGMGGGTTLDTAKAVANLYTNPGHAAEYQGWDLVKNPSIYKIGIPTISGTGAESSRTCVLTNTDTGLKLGMNSDHTLYSQLVLDPDLPATVERNQYFFTGMDAYIHCIESLAGRYRNPIGDSLSEEVVSLCRKVFLSDDMMSDDNRERLMVASYLGGCAIATSFVGVVHPISAGLSVVLGLHHCVANCITMLVMDDFYPRECEEFRAMIAAQGVQVPTGVCADASDDQIMAMCQAASLHEKPLANALGDDFRQRLPPERMAQLYRRM